MSEYAHTLEDEGVRRNFYLTFDGTFSYMGMLNCPGIARAFSNGFIFASSL